MRKLLSIMALVVIALLSFSFVSALDMTNDLQVSSVRVNDDYVQPSDVLAVDEGQALSIRVGLTAQSDVQDIEVEAKIAGYEYSDHENLLDSTPLFDMEAGTTKYVNLEVRLPRQLDQDHYSLRLRVMDRNTAAISYEYQLAVEALRHGVDIADVAFSPGSSVRAGRSLLATVLLQNFGQRNENDVKVTVAVPSLGINAVEFVDVQSTPDDTDFQDVPEMFLPIPASAAPGDYQVQVTADYDLYETVSKTFTIHVLENEQLAPRGDESVVVLAAGPETQTIAAGTSARYAVALSNAGRQSRAFVLEAPAGDWASVSLSDSLVVLEPGRNQVVYVTVQPTASAVAGQHAFSVAVKSGNTVLQTVTLNANVVQGQAAASGSLGLRNGLEIALIVLVVLLVIVGLIIGFTRLRKDEEDEEQTYY
ncbi:hypothetical protein HYU22_04160 [Candidatus Woesearchaeota archaeon]|nr:hypothetical protein [Candidatus Woesearchaeota archaeon]